jgi:hypothetical protein
MFGSGGGGGGQPQIVYKDAPIEPLPAPTPTPMNSGVQPAFIEGAYSDGAQSPATKNLGTSMFKINRDPTATNDYQDQGLDSGLYY